MKSLEQFRAEQAEAMKKAEAAYIERLGRAQCFGDAGLPIPEYIAESNLYGAVTCTYRNSGGLRQGHKPETLRSMSEAVSLFQQFADKGLIIPFHVLKASCTVTQPEQYMSERLKKEGYKRDAYKSAGYAAELRVVHSVERYNTNAEIEFFAHIGKKLFRVCINFGQGYIGQCPRLAPRVEKETYQSRTVARHIHPNADAAALSDALISYSYGGDIGPMKTGADHRFLFVADYDDAPTECAHALAQLENLAGIVDGVNK